MGLVKMKYVFNDITRLLKKREEKESFAPPPLWW
jgi:hypothetical protein